MGPNSSDQSYNLQINCLVTLNRKCVLKLSCHFLILLKVLKDKIAISYIHVVVLPDSFGLICQVFEISYTELYAAASISGEKNVVIDAQSIE